MVNDENVSKPIATNRYTAVEAAAFLSITPETVKKMCRDKKIEAKKVGPKKQWILSGEAVLAKMKEWEMI